MRDGVSQQQETRRRAPESEIQHHDNVPARWRWHARRHQLQQRTRQQEEKAVESRARDRRQRVAGTGSPAKHRIERDRDSAREWQEGAERRRRGTFGAGQRDGADPDDREQQADESPAGHALTQQGHREGGDQHRSRAGDDRAGRRVSEDKTEVLECAEERDSTQAEKRWQPSRGGPLVTKGQQGDQESKSDTGPPGTNGERPELAHRRLACRGRPSPDRVGGDQGKQRQPARSGEADGQRGERRRGDPPR